MKEEKLNGISTDTTTDKYTDDIADVKSLQEQVKKDNSYIKKPLPKGAKLKRITFTKDMAICLAMIYRYFAYHPEAEEGKYFPKRDLFSELKHNVGKELADKITRNYHRLKYWDCITPMPTSPDQIIYRKGWWAITDVGARFIQKDIGLPKYAEIYDDFPYNHITIPIMITDLIPPEELTELLKL